MLAALAGACGSTGAGGTGGAGGAKDSALPVVPGAPAAPAQEPESDPFTIEGYASAMASYGSVTAVGTTTAVYRLTAAGAVRLEIVGDEIDLPVETGEVRAAAPYDGGLLIAAANGLFFTDGAALQLSLANDTLGPLGITAATARITDAGTDSAPEVHLAFLASGGAYEIAGGVLSQWKVDGEDGAPTAIFAQEARVYLSFGHHTYEIDKATKKAYPLAFDIGNVHEIACGSLSCDEGSLLYFASDEGLVERSADGAYRSFPLAAAGAAPVPVEAFALDAQRQRLYAVAGTSILRVRAGEVPDAVATLDPATSPRRLAADAAGDVWVGEGLAARRYALGTPLSFATDVRPILHEYCAECHANGSQGAPLRDFESYDVAKSQIDVILGRVQNGTMPPASYGKKLPAESIQILLDWSITKAP